MQNWRERGCVSDSDEDESFYIDSQTRLSDDDTARDKKSGRRQGSEELGEHEVQEEEQRGQADHTNVTESRYTNNEQSSTETGSVVRATTQSWTVGDDLEIDWTKSKPQRSGRTYGRKASRNAAHNTTHERPTTGLDQLFSSNSAQQDVEHSRSSAVSSGLDHAGDQQDSQEREAKSATVTNNITSVDSSPLSSPGSSDSEDFPMHSKPSRVVAAAIDQSHGTQDLLANNNAFPNLELQGLADRRFRSRKPIQMNPYQIERETYKKSWQARGMVPVRIVGSQAEAPTTVRNPQEETQDAWQPDDSQASAASPASPVISEPPSPRNVFATVIEQGQGEDEFPDVDRLMHRAVPGQMQPTFKRRKLMESPSISRPPPIDFAQADLSNVTHLPEPPTPPATDSTTSSADNGTERTVKFRFPKGFKRSGLITPNVSSPAPVDSSGGPVDDARTEIVNVEDQERDGTDESSPSADDNLPDFSKVRRRIKGVLPASWLRLDSKAQKPPSPRKAHSSVQRSTSGVGLPAKGVAQRRIGSSTPAGVNKQVRRDLTFDSEESEQESLIRSPLPVHKNASGHGSLRQLRIDTGSAVPNDVDSDDMEDNAIDMMLPSAPRQRQTTETPTRYQRRVTDTFRPYNDANPAKGSSVVLRENQKSSTTLSKQARSSRHKQTRQKRTPLLSILDAQQPHSDQASRIPQFVRLASRQARQRSNHGRHSPSKKVLRLATAADTDDAMATLTSWYKGDLVQSHVPTPHRSVGSILNQRLGLVREQPAGEGPDQDSDEVIEVSRSMHVRPRPASSTSSGRRSRATPRAASKSVQALAPYPGLHRQQGLRSLARGAPQGNAPETNGTFGTMQAVVGSRTAFRSGQLEMEGRRFDLGGRRLPHLYKASSLQQLLTRGQNAPSLSLPLERYLKDPTPPLATVAAEVPRTTTRNKLTHRPRQKPVARRLDTETVAYRQPSEPLPVTLLPAAEASTVDASRPGLQGLGSYGTKYSTDFDVHPLEVGTYFHESTFIGSGDFEAALSLQNRDLDETAGYITINVGDHNLRWSAWNEDVANGLAQVYQISQEAFSAMKDASSDDRGRMLVQGASETVSYLLRSVVRYCSKCLYFSDSVDREQCLARFSLFIEDYANELYEARTNMGFAAHSRSLFLDAYLYLLCLSHQMVVISQQKSVPEVLCERLSNRFRCLSQLCVDFVLKTGCHDLRIFYEDMRHHERRDRGIRNDQITARALVILHHTLQQASPMGRSFAELACTFLVKPVHETNNIRLLDQAWYDIFTLQPILEIDRRGIYRPGNRSTLSNGNWSAVKMLLDNLFALYPGSLDLRNPTLNDYIRSNLVRVYVLVNRWHWSTCEIALNSIYDFFAKRGLAHLSGEDPKGSPRFLEQTETNAILEVNIREPTFHIFLKLLAVGLRSIPQQYPSAKVKRVVWRYVPNHGRTYRKDEDVQRSDLDALQNHHDLLCTLVWTLPPGCRPRLENIRDLVDFHASHQEACRINVNAWKMLARIVVSRSDQDDDIDSLTSWFREIVTAMSQQYRLARAEAEMVQDMAHLRSLGQVSFDQVQMVVSKNQKNIIDTLLLAIAGMQEAFKTVRCADVARKLLEQSHVLDIFNMFDAGQKRTFNPVLQTLVVCQHYLKLEKQNIVRQESSEESQDYGSFDGLEDMVLDDSSATITESVDMDDFLSTGVAQLLSNVFGADAPVDESLLARLVEVWTGLVARSVSNGTKLWSQYLEAHSPDSWFRLRQTDSVRKWTPFFLSKILEYDHSSFEDNKDIMLSTWLVSLLDRESMLKFQHILTSAILNAGNDEGLTENPPFARDRDLGLFNITLNELRAGRISLIASVLSNMRITYELARGNQAELKSRYSQMLKQAMIAMKTTYQEVSQNETVVADPNVGGSYVSFVHQVVSMMQQHTLDICAIDKFFTDSAAFPLPLNDPGYVVGRIKRHESRLPESSGRKQLAFFLQTRSQAAAINNENQVLACQISTAMILAEQGSRFSGPTLREIFFAAILPAYLQATIEHDAGWILALPMMEAARQTHAETLYHVNFHNIVEAQAELHLIDILLHHLLLVLHSIKPPSDSQYSSRMYAIIASVFSTALPIVGLLDLAQRIHTTMPLYDRLGLLFECATYIRSLLSSTNHETQQTWPILLENVAPHNQYRTDLDFTRRNLVSELSGYWSKVGDEWTVRNTRVDSSCADEGAIRAKAVAAVEEFVECYRVLIGDEERVRSTEVDGYGLGLGDVML